MAWIERIEVEEGFLDGLDLEFAPGLNVVIGARGAGKTSMLELIRFVLGATTFTDRAAAASEAQIRAVLGRGRVTLTVREDDGGARTVSRSLDSRAAPSLQATVLAQNEIEAVGASASGRLHLVDRFVSVPLAAEIQGVETAIAALAIKIDAGLDEVSALSNRLAELPHRQAELDRLKSEQALALERAQATDAEKNELAALQEGLQLASLRAQLVEQTIESVSLLESRLRATAATSPPPEWPSEAGADPTSSARSAFDAATRAAHEATAEPQRSLGELGEAVESERAERSEAESRAREIRRRLGAVDAELSSLSNEVAKTSEAIGNLKGLEERRSERQARLKAAIDERRGLYGRLESLRQQRFDARREIVDRLNASLKPAIKLELVQSAEMDDYVNQIVASLRGSGLHSRTLAPELAAAFTPLELVELVEARDVDAAVAATSLAPTRVESAFERLRESSAGAIAAVSIDDAVELFLLDVGQFKPSATLSIGQRCTAVLPVLLEQHGDLLIIDQPEDHLDNAFVTSTLVEALRSRPKNHQVILSSHNANVPVLGEADRVIHLDSNGRRGFVAHAGSLDDPETVQAVTDVMEGGAEAFQRRADFYRLHGHA